MFQKSFNELKNATSGLNYHRCQRGTCVFFCNLGSLYTHTFPNPMPSRCVGPHLPLFSDKMCHSIQSATNECFSFPCRVSMKWQLRLGYAHAITKKQCISSTTGAHFRISGYSVIEATNINLTQLQEAVEDRRACRALVHGVTKSRTRLNNKNNNRSKHFFYS